MRSEDWSNKAACLCGIHITVLRKKRCWKVCFCTSWSQKILVPSETKQDWVQSIHFLWLIQMQLRDIAHAEHTHALLLNDLPSFNFFSLLSKEQRSPERWCSKGLCWFLWDGGQLELVQAAGSEELRSLCHGGGAWPFLIVGGCPFSSVGRRWPHKVGQLSQQLK